MQEINLYDLVKHYVKHWYVILLSLIIGIGIGYAYNQWIQVPAYKSDASLLVVSGPDTNSVEKTTAINNYLELLKSRRVLEPVITELELDQSYDQFIQSVSTSNDKDTEVLKLSVSSRDPKKSKDIVDATIESFKREINNFYEKDTIQVIDKANLPDQPYNVRKNLQLILISTASLLTAVTVLFFIYDFKLSSGQQDKPKQAKANKPVRSLHKPQPRDENGKFIKTNPASTKKAQTTPDSSVEAKKKK